MRKSYFFIKRVLDIFLAILLAVPALIIVILCYVLIKIETNGPAFFVQDRPGYKGRLFRIYKLRSMIEETQRDGKPLSDMERMTKIGRIIRKFSLDELPQILNILKGDMSFIGPRPLLVQYLGHYSEYEMRRHDVLPGISGWAQVNGRNEISWGQKFERDVWYVDHISLKLDIKILWMTIVSILKRQGINAGVGETMSIFGEDSQSTSDHPSSHSSVHNEKVIV